MHGMYVKIIYKNFNGANSL